ncbi:MAG: hypothetical protein M1838_000722 [Thelocarpon superellum]|nr:MAG: hypothetical protein M1838_000722 [Thelocarpon superellum]
MPESEEPIVNPSAPANLGPHRPSLTADHPWKWVKDYRTEIAASSSSVLSTFFSYPLDSVKTRMQAYHFTNFTDCVKHTYRTEGGLSFWRGVSAPLVSVTVVRTISFSIYQKAKYLYSGWIESATGSSPLTVVNTLGSMPTLATLTCFGAAGATSGAAVTVVACPFEYTKLSAQIAVLMARNKTGSMDEPLRRNYEQMGTFETARTIVKHRGLLGLYSGFHLHLMRDTLGTAIYFMTYESCKQVLATSKGHSPTHPVAVAIAGGLCGVVSWACIYPIDSSKSIYQRNCLTQSPLRTQAAPKIDWFNPRMYRGIGVSMSRSAVVNAVFFSSFEYIKKRINRLEG